MADPTKPRASFAPWDRRELPGSFSVEETARRVGNYTWAETKLFEVLGGWIATVPELREMNPARLTLPANDALVRFVDAMT